MGLKMFNVASYANKATPVGADLLPLGDSASLGPGSVPNSKTCTLTNLSTAVLLAAQVAGTVDVLGGLVTQGLRAASENPPLNLGTGAITAGATGVTTLTTSGKLTTYNAVVTAGWGAPAVYGNGRVAGTVDARAAAVATYTVGAADGSFEVSGNVLVTASVTHSFSLDVSYTDESNTARVLILPMALITGSYLSGGLITNVSGAVPYHGAVLQIRCKAATPITIRVSNGTFTSVTYNSEGSIKQVA